jgi:hypothetical protein
MTMVSRNKGTVSQETVWDDKWKFIVLNS